MSIIEEEEPHKPIPLNGVKKIEEQMENCICKIKKNEEIGTGFICKITDKLFVFVTNSHILNKKDIEENKVIDISTNNKSIKIIMDKNRKKYTNRELDITIIELKPNKDEIDKYLEIDEEDINKKEDKSVYILHYPGEEVSVSYGVIKEIKKEKIIEHSFITKEGSSGSPIISLKTYKVVGIHCGCSIYENEGLYIKYAIDKFINEDKT